MDPVLLQIWDAESFDYIFTNGKTLPLKIGVTRRDANGVKETREVVIKSLENPGMTQWSLVAELFGNVLAHHFHVRTPLPMVVNLSTEFVNFVQKNSAFLQQSKGQINLKPGFAVGCQYIKGMAQFSRPVKLDLPTEQEWARLLFAFDMLVQNPDRRTEKHNVGLLNNQAIAYDFEMCFAFVYNLPFLANATLAWQIDEKVAKDHIFYPGLRGKIHNWQPFINRLSLMDCDIMEQTLGELNALFSAGSIYPEKVLRHLRDVKSNSDKFQSELDRNLK